MRGSGVDHRSSGSDLVVMLCIRSGCASTISLPQNINLVHLDRQAWLPYSNMKTSRFASATQLSRRTGRRKIVYSLGIGIGIIFDVRFLKRPHKDTVFRTAQTDMVARIKLPTY